MSAAEMETESAIARADNTNLVAISNKNRFKFADDGPVGAIVIRKLIMLNRDEAEAISQLEELLKNQQKRVWHSFVGTSEDVRVMRISSNNFNQIRIGMERYFRRYGYGFRI
jgi:hypothetical protein